MRKFCNEVAAKYFEERAKKFDEVKKEEWIVVRKTHNKGQKY